MRARANQFEETGLRYETTVVGIPYEQIEELIEHEQTVSLSVGTKQVAVVLVGAIERIGERGVRVRAKGIKQSQENFK